MILINGNYNCRQQENMLVVEQGAYIYEINRRIPLRIPLGYDFFMRQYGKGFLFDAEQSKFVSCAKTLIESINIGKNINFFYGNHSKDIIQSTLV